MHYYYYYWQHWPWNFRPLQRHDSFYVSPLTPDIETHRLAIDASVTWVRFEMFARPFVMRNIEVSRYIYVVSSTMPALRRLLTTRNYSSCPWMRGVDVHRGCLPMNKFDCGPWWLVVIDRSDAEKKKLLAVLGRSAVDEHVESRRFWREKMMLWWSRE